MIMKNKSNKHEKTGIINWKNGINMDKEELLSVKFSNRRLKCLQKNEEIKFWICLKKKVE